MKAAAIAALFVVACSHQPPTPTTPPRNAAPNAGLGPDAALAADDGREPEQGLEPDEGLEPDARLRALATGGAVDYRCPVPPDVTNPACLAIMPCPTPPVPQVRACKRPIECSSPRAGCEAWWPPVIGRVVATHINGDVSAVVIGVGSRQGIGPGWRATLVRGASSASLAGGTVTLISVDERETLGTVRLPVEEIEANPRVRFDPPRP